MQTFERRIAALEQASPNGITAMFIHIVGMGETDKEIQTIASSYYIAKRQEWTREPGESVQDFQGRAEREEMPSPTGCKVFLCSSRVGAL